MRDNCCEKCNIDWEIFKWRGVTKQTGNNLGVEEGEEEKGAS